MKFVLWLGLETGLWMQLKNNLDTQLSLICLDTESVTQNNKML